MVNNNQYQMEKKVKKWFKTTFKTEEKVTNRS